MASTTFIDNQTTIFADWLNDVNTAVYTGVFPNGSLSLTTLNVTGAVTGAGFTSLINNTLSAPGAIGGATPNTGAFTTLSATTLSATTLNTTAITGITTPLTRAQGGTGLSAAGASGNVLTSDGTNWTSTSSQSLGVGQTWQLFTINTQRFAGTTYTNNTGKPIIVHIGVSSGGASTYAYTITVDGVALYYSAYAYVVGDTVVPPGSTYVVTPSLGNLANWAELR